MDITLELLRELIKAVDASTVDHMQLKTDKWELTLERSREVPAAASAPAAAQVLLAQAPAPQPAAPAPAGNVMKSPIVGTFYASAAPDKPPFAPVGKKVCKGDVLFIIESMKLMNEIVSEFDGTVAEIFVKSGQPVEFGQPILRIE